MAQITNMRLPATPELVILGHIARDLILRNGQNSFEERLGGAAAFASLTATEFGLRTGLITRSPLNFPLGDPLWRNPLLDAFCQPADLPTTFELDYRGPQRLVRLAQRAPSLDPQRIPPPFRQCKVAYVAPIIGECDQAIVDLFRDSFVIVGAQGWLREADAEGQIRPRVQPELLSPSPSIDVLTFSELDHPDADQLAREFNQTIPTVAVTRGSQGATIYDGGKAFDVRTTAAVEVDPTGAGDVFAMVLGLSIHAGHSTVRAAELACEAGARVVEGPGLGHLPQSLAHQNLRGA